MMTTHIVPKREAACFELTSNRSIIQDTKMEPEVTPITPAGTFRFACSNCVACFNECCRDLNQFLTPYDILRLKNRLALTSNRFLETFTTQHTGPETGLPVVALKPADPLERRCPFVKASGCSVYQDRPSSCRIYPLARALSRSRETGQTTEHFALLRESHCLGHQEEKSQTVQTWIKSQELALYNQHNDRLLEIISLKNCLKPGPLDMASARMFHLALYDLDTFRRKIFKDGLFSDFTVETGLLTRARKDDTCLLQIGYAWIKTTLFNAAVSFLSEDPRQTT